MIFSIPACCLNTWRAYQSTMTIFFYKILFVTEIQRESTQAGEAAIITWAKQMLNCYEPPRYPSTMLSYFPDLLDKFLDSLPVHFFVLATTKSTDYLSHYFALFVCHWVCYCFDDGIGYSLSKFGSTLVVKLLVIMPCPFVIEQALPVLKTWFYWFSWITALLF